MIINRYEDSPPVPRDVLQPGAVEIEKAGFWRSVRKHLKASVKIGFRVTSKGVPVPTFKGVQISAKGEF